MDVESMHVKEEPTDFTPDQMIENRILSLCEQNPMGIMIDLLPSELAEFPRVDIQRIANMLLTTKKVEMKQRSIGKEKKQVLKLKSGVPVPRPKKVVGLTDNLEKAVYQMIEQAGNKGIWNKDIRTKLRMPITTESKILKALESRKLIKSVKSVKAKTRKIYMLYDLEPDTSVTGGIWYSGQNFDAEFVKCISDGCLMCLKKKAEAAAKLQAEMSLEPMAQRNATFASSADILDFINRLNLSRVKLSVVEIEAIMDALVYDGKVERGAFVGGAGAGEQTSCYRAVSQLIQPTGLMRMPCGHCPVIGECHEGGAISPATCRYMQEWLDLKLDF